MDIRAVRTLWLAMGVAVASIAVVPVASSSPETSPRDPLAVTQARSIQLEVSSRYVRLGGHGLEVTEASSTGVVESFTLLAADLTKARIVPADNGVYYAVCPVQRTCPYPARRFAHSAAAFLARRIALELAVRTFQETSADVVAVSLPTRRFVLFIIERREFDQEDFSSQRAILARNPRLSTPVVRRLIDQVTRPRVYAVMGLEPTSSGRDTVGAVPVWPETG